MLSLIRCVALRTEAQFVGPAISLRYLSTTNGSDINIIKPFDSIPGPNGIYSVPYIGSMFHFKPFTDIPALDITLLQKRLNIQYGDILRFRMGRGWIVGLFHPDLCREALQVTQPRFPSRFPVWIIRKYAERMGIEEGMGTVNGEKWEAIRKPTQHEILRPSSLESYAPMINDVADDMVTRLREQATIDDTLFTLYNYAIENIGMLFFNSRLGCLDGGKTADEIVRNVAFVFHALEVDLRTSFHWYRYFRTPFYNKFEQSLNTLKSMIQPELDDCISLYHTRKIEGNPEDKQKTNCLVHNLLSGGMLTAEQINLFIIDIFLSGIDSTAKTMSLVLNRLALHQDKQEKLYQEIRAHGLTNGQPLTNDILNSMSYLKACTKESMRMHFPISGGYITAAQSDIVVGQYKIPEKTLLMVACPTMVQDDRFFENSDQYLPERWLRSDIVDSDPHKTLNSFAFLPFGFGKRSCLGQRFAERELHIGITKLIQNFALSVPRENTDVSWEYRVFATPRDKLILNLDMRK